MKKQFHIAMMIAALTLGALPVQASSQAALISDIADIRESTIWEDQEEAPGLKITIKDVYEKAGETEEIDVELRGAVWVDGNGASLQPYEITGVRREDISILGYGEDSIKIKVNIPSGIKEEDAISFVIPLMVEINDSKAKIIVDGKEIIFGATTQKQVEWKVDEVPTLIKEGNLADITLTELRPYSIEDELTIKLTLQNKNLAFGDFEYLTKSVNDADTDYTLKSANHVIYGSGATGNSEEIKLKTNNRNDREITFKIDATGSSDKGTITLTNIPIINKNEDFEDEDVLLTIESEAILSEGKDVVVAYIRHQTVEEQKAEEEAQKEAEAEAERIEEALKAQEKEAKAGIQFKVGESAYHVDGTTYNMDAKSFIQEPGYIMVPLKYVAMSLGVSEDKILFNNGMIYFTYNDRTIELRVGSDIATVNRGNIKMETPVVIVDGRSYAPMGEVAKLLGLHKAWNGTEKIAIFKTK